MTHVIIINNIFCKRIAFLILPKCQPKKKKKRNIIFIHFFRAHKIRAYIYSNQILLVKFEFPLRITIIIIIVIIIDCGNSLKHQHKNHFLRNEVYRGDDDGWKYYKSLDNWLQIRYFFFRRYFLFHTKKNFLPLFFFNFIEELTGRQSVLVPFCTAIRIVRRMESECVCVCQCQPHRRGGPVETQNNSQGNEWGNITRVLYYYTSIIIYLLLPIAILKRSWFSAGVNFLTCAGDK